MSGRWAVLNCAVTQILSRHDDEESAELAAKEWGNCSFPYLLEGEVSES